MGEMSSSACALSYLVPILAMDRSVGAVSQLSAWCQWNEHASCTFLDHSRCYCFVGTCLRGVEVYWNCALVRSPEGREKVPSVCWLVAVVSDFE